MVGLAIGTALIPAARRARRRERRAGRHGRSCWPSCWRARRAAAPARGPRRDRCRWWRSRCCARWRLFEALPAPALEGLARALEPLELPAGTVVIREGDIGDRYYAIADGEVEVWRQGRCVARLGRGDGFGEIALLEEIPRTADVTAITDVRLYALAKEPFVTAVAGYPPAAQVADELVTHVRADLARHAPG